MLLLRRRRLIHSQRFAVAEVLAHLFGLFHRKPITTITLIKCLKARIQQKVCVRFCETLDIWNTYKLSAEHTAITYIKHAFTYVHRATHKHMSQISMDDAVGGDDTRTPTFLGTVVVGTRNHRSSSSTWKLSWEIDAFRNPSWWYLINEKWKKKKGHLQNCAKDAECRRVQRVDSLTKYIYAYPLYNNYVEWQAANR